MTYLVGLAAVSLIIFGAHHLRNIRNISAPFRSLSFFKLNYLVFGMFIVLFFPDNFMIQFERSREAIIMFCISWIGLYYGCGLELRAHQKFPSKVILFNILEPMIVFVFVTIIATLFFYFKYDGWDFTNIAVIIAIFCSFSIFRRHGILKREGDSSHHPVLDDLLPVGNIFPVFALSIAGALLFGTQNVTIVGYTFTGFFSIVILNILFGVVGGVLFNMLISAAESSDAISIILIGGTALCGGIAHVFSFSPLFVGTISGAFLINATLKRLQTLKALNNTNEIIERLFMFVLGTLLSPLVQLLKTDMIYILLYALVLFVFRSTLKYIVSSLCISRIQNKSEDSTLLWIGLTGQGILASGAAFECAFYVHPSSFIFLLFVTVLFLNQLAVGLYIWYKEKTKNTGKVNYA